ncbi:putative WRKY transcription factor [Arachis hypogaea]|uniref:Putative WRKY transcription factor n=1 Tax=Arachis hypogaea TaxID=3818 RepID=A0A6B9V7R0_ARAHY|nr:putative WRKY transcription factor [Arachis hypogaea]
MAGIGKTTIATTLFHECSSEYEVKLLSRLLNEDLRIDNIRVIHSSIIRKIEHRRIFVVLDDVTNSQITADLIQLFRSCLSSDSRIILTTRDKNVLTSGGVEEIHEVKEMNFEDSLKLFSHNAFSDSHPKEDYYELSTRVVADYAKGIPLALKILGSFLRTKEESEWDSALNKLRKYPNADIQQVLRLSYDALDDDEKNILLDVACFFHGQEMENVTRILISCGYFADIGIKSLLNKSLMSINSYNHKKYIKMHSLIQEMCWKIIHEESSENRGQQTRLWNAEEICNIFQHERDIHGVESMVVDMNEITIDPLIIIISLRKMPKLRLLALRGNINMDLEWNRVLLEDFQLPNDLRYIEWNKCPLNFVPSICWPQKLVQLSMRESNVQKLWNTVQV